MIEFSKKDVEIVEQKTAHQGFMGLLIYQLRYRLFAGGWSEILTRECVLRRQAVTILAYDPVQDSLIFVEQIRLGALACDNPWMLEVVAGVIEPDETASQVATRELVEETGCQALHCEHVLDYFSSPGGSTEQLSLYCARVDASQALEFRGVASEGEDIRVHVLSVKTVLDMLAQNQFKSGPTILALQWFANRYQSLRNEWLQED